MWKIFRNIYKNRTKVRSKNVPKNALFSYLPILLNNTTTNNDEKTEKATLRNIKSNLTSIFFFNFLNRT